jgi:hypothetical protein
MVLPKKEDVDWSMLALAFNLFSSPVDDRMPTCVGDVDDDDQTC